MELTSPDFDNNGLIPSKFTCEGEDISPNLEIHNVPHDAESLVLIVEDPDAPGGTWVHWVVWNLSPETQRLIAGTLPLDAKEGKTSFSHPGYGGPCPPSNTHRYYFRLYALNSSLNMPTEATADDLRDAMEGKIVGDCELVGLYARDEE